MDIIVLLLLWFVAVPLIGLALLHTAVANSPDVDDEDDEVRPKLRGEGLNAWTQLYQANMQIWRTTAFTTTNDVERWTWNDYERLTGKPQWVKVVKETPDGQK